MLMPLFSALVFRIQLSMYSFQTYTYLFPKLARKQLRYTWINSLKKISVFQTGMITAISEICCHSSMPAAYCQWNCVIVFHVS